MSSSLAPDDISEMYIFSQPYLSHLLNSKLLRIPEPNPYPNPDPNEWFRNSKHYFDVVLDGPKGATLDVRVVQLILQLRIEKEQKTSQSTWPVYLYVVCNNTHFLPYKGARQPYWFEKKWVVFPIKGELIANEKHGSSTDGANPNICNIKLRQPFEEDGTTEKSPSVCLDENLPPWYCTANVAGNAIEKTFLMDKASVAKANSDAKTLLQLFNASGVLPLLWKRITDEVGSLCTVQFSSLASNMRILSLKRSLTDPKTNTPSFLGELQSIGAENELVAGSTEGNRVVEWRFTDEQIAKLPASVSGCFIAHNSVFSKTRLHPLNLDIIAGALFDLNINLFPSMVSPDFPQSWIGDWIVGHPQFSEQPVSADHQVCPGDGYFYRSQTSISSKTVWRFVGSSLAATMMPEFLVRQIEASFYVTESNERAAIFCQRTYSRYVMKPFTEDFTDDKNVKESVNYTVQFYRALNYYFKCLAGKVYRNYHYVQDGEKPYDMELEARIAPNNNPLENNQRLVEALNQPHDEEVYTIPALAHWPGGKATFFPSAGNDMGPSWDCYLVQYLTP